MFFNTEKVGNNGVLTPAGPFTFTGKCTGSGAGDAKATPYIRTSQDGSRYTDYGDANPANAVLNSGSGDVRIQWRSSSSDSSSPDLGGPDDGFISAISHDVQNYALGGITTATYV